MQDQERDQATEGPKEKALRALTTAETFLEAACREIPSIAEMIRSGRHDAAGEQLRLLLGGMDSLARLAVDMETVLSQPAQVERDLDLPGLRSDLAKLVSHQEAREWEDVAATIERSIGPRLSPWREHFRAQVEKLRVLA